MSLCFYGEATFFIFVTKFENMEYQIIPINTIKRIESWLNSEVGFSRSMFHNELDYISDVYLLGNKFPMEIQDLYLSIKKEEQEIPYPNCGTDEDKYEFSMTVGQNLVLESGNFKAEYIETLWNTYNKNEDEVYEQQDQDVFYAILLIVSIYYKCTQTNGYFDFEDYIADPTQLKYSYSVRPDMLRLYKMFHEKKKTKSNIVTIEYNKQKIELTNDDSWFLNMITPYLDKYLGVSTLEEAETELDKDYPSIGKRGRKRENAILDTITLSIYNLLRHSSFAAKGKGLTDNEGNFILGLLKYLKLIDEDSPKNDMIQHSFHPRAFVRVYHLTIFSHYYMRGLVAKLSHIISAKIKRGSAECIFRQWNISEDVLSLYRPGNHLASADSLILTVIDL